MPEARLCSTDEVEPGQARRFTVGKVAIAVVRLDDDWYAIGDVCSHQKISLAEGEVDPVNKSIECWKHGSQFSLVDGTPHSLPATKPVPVYSLRLDGDDVMVTIP